MCKPRSTLVILGWTLSLLLIALLFLFGNALADDRRTQLHSPQNTSVTRIHSTITPTSNFVLYSRNATPEDSIWIMDDAGDRQLMPGAHPRLSPDGRYIVHKRDHTWEGDIYVRDLETGQDTKVFTSTDIAANYGWTPDGSQIVFDHWCTIHVMERDGSNQQEIIGDWPYSGDDNCYNDSPSVNMVDGRIAWDNVRHGIGLADADGQNPHWIPNTVPGDVWPSWSPDATWIAFYKDSEDEAKNYYKIHPGGTGLTQLTYLSLENDGFGPAGPWSADGEWLVAPGTVDGVDGLYAVSTSGNGIVVPISIRAGAGADFVGSVGNLEINQVFLPLDLRGQQ
jgi:hypothetical protein